jgi:hypothetical protein
VGASPGEVFQYTGTAAVISVVDGHECDTGRPATASRIWGGLLTFDEECQESAAFTRSGLEIDRKFRLCVRGHEPAEQLHQIVRDHASKVIGQQIIVQHEWVSRILTIDPPNLPHACGLNAPLFMSRTGCPVLSLPPLGLFFTATSVRRHGDAYSFHVPRMNTGATGWVAYAPLSHASLPLSLVADLNTPAER